MSRVGKMPVAMPKGVEFSQADAVLKIKGPNGELSMALNPEIEVEINDGVATVAARSGSRFARAMAGTTRALMNNMVTGVTDGFERKLELVGVGYRAQVQGKLSRIGVKGRLLPADGHQSFNV